MQQQGFGGFGGGYGMSQQGGFGQITPQQNSPVRQSFEQFIASGGPRGGGAGFFNALQGGQGSPQEEQAAKEQIANMMQGQP